MALVRPPITDDPALNSFLNQALLEISKASLDANNVKKSLLEFESNNNSATLYLYKRALAGETPSDITSEVIYNYKRGTLALSVDKIPTNIIDGWSFNTPPNIADGDFIWQVYVHISSDIGKETISPEAWSTPEIVSIDPDIIASQIPTPSSPANISITQISSDIIRLSWVYNETDTEFAGLYARIEASYDQEEWKAIAYSTSPTASIDILGHSSLDVNKYYRVVAANVLTQEESPPSSARKYTPPNPSSPTNVQLQTVNSDEIKLTWDYSNSLAKVQLFEVEVAYSNGVYDLKTIVSPDKREVIISGISSLSETALYRIRAIGLNNKKSSYSNIVSLDPETPTTPTSAQFIQNTKNVGTLSWDHSDNTVPLAFYLIEESVGDESNYTHVATISPEVGVYKKTGLTSEDDKVYFRVKAVGVNRIESEWATHATFTPGTPNAPLNVQYSRITEDEGKLIWDYTDNFSTVRNFIIQVREVGSLEFITSASVDGEDRSYIISGMSTKSKDFEYRIIAVSTHGRKSQPSSIINVSPSTVEAPTNLTLQEVREVGTINSVKLNWTPPSDLFNQYSIITAQLKHESDNLWRDVATVPAASTSVEFQPSRQGTLIFRVSATAVNGIESAYSNEASIFISGGSATDNAIYNGDAAFLATKHYSVNTDDKFMNDIGGVEIISGGTYNAVTDKITGTLSEPLVVQWRINVTDNEVIRNRHYYLNLDNLDTVSGNPSPWSVDKQNVLVKIISSVADAAPFYINDGTPLDNFIYVGSNESSSDIRTYSDRFSGEYMYATRDYLSLSMKRTFTFRQSANALVEFTFLPQEGEVPLIDLNTGNELKLEAFASELLDSTEMTVDNLGSVWTFDEDFEAAPSIFITPQADVRTWFTNKSNTSVRIHASSSTTVDVTARGR